MINALPYQSHHNKFVSCAGLAYSTHRRGAYHPLSVAFVSKERLIAVVAVHLLDANRILLDSYTSMSS